MSSRSLIAFAHQLIRTRGAESCYLDYAPSFGSGPFGYVLCTSVNDAVLHGKPNPYRLEDGDLLTLDFAASVDGWVADSAVSLVVGEARADDLELIELTEAALRAGIAAAVVGNKIGDISAAIGTVALNVAASIRPTKMPCFVSAMVEVLKVASNHKSPAAFVI